MLSLVIGSTSSDSEPAAWRGETRGRWAGRGRLSGHSFSLTWGDLGLHSRLWHPDDHRCLCEMSSWPWVAWEVPSPVNDEPQPEHLGRFGVQSGSPGRDAAQLPHGVGYAENFLYLCGFYWVMTWILCRGKTLCIQGPSQKATKPYLGHKFSGEAKHLLHVSHSKDELLFNCD